MNTCSHAVGLVAALAVLHGARAATLTNRFEDVSPQVQCNQPWTNQNVVLPDRPGQGRRHQLPFQYSRALRLPVLPPALKPKPFPDPPPHRSTEPPLMHLQVRQLSECPEHLITVGTWIYHQWWSRCYPTPEVVFSRLRNHTQKDTVPFTVVAFADGLPVGSCCVLENDCVYRKQYSPWVAAVFVKPDMRNCGVASRILQEAAAIATRINVPGLYIDCHVLTARVYEKNGWKIYEREVGDKDSVVMLRPTSDATPPRPTP